MSVNIKNINRIENILKKNGVKYNPRFNKIITFEFTVPNSYKLVENTIELIEEITFTGVNYGFKNFSDHIQELINCCLVLGEKNADKKISKLKKTIDLVRDDYYTQVAKLKNKVDVRDSVKKWIDTTSEGVEFLLKQVKGTVQTQTLTLAKEMLVEMEEQLNNVSDISSKRAADYSMSVVNELTKFRNLLAQRQFNDFALDNLKNAVLYTKQWTELVDAVSLKNPRASEKDLPVYILSDFDKVLLCEKLKNRMISFKENVDSFKENLDQRFNNEQLTHEIENLKAQKSDFEKEMINIKSQAQNGRISIDEAKRRIEIKKNSYLRIKDKVELLEAKYTEKMEEYDIQKFAAMDMMEIYNDIMSYEQDPTLFSILSEKIDLTGLHNILRGTIKGEKSKEAFETVYYVLRVMKEIRNSQVSNLQDMENIYNEAYMKSQETKVQLKTKEKQNDKVATMEDLDDLFNDMGLDTKEDTPLEEEQEENVQSVNKLDDDIFNF